MRLVVPCLFLVSATASAQPPPPQPPPPPPPAPYPQPYPQPQTYPQTQPYPQPYGTTPQPQPTGPSAGGLYAPPPVDQTGDPRNQTERDLDESKEDDSDRGLKWFYIDAGGGFQHIGLETFKVDESNLTAGLVPTEASGGFFGVGLGVQLFILRLGPRFRAGFFSDFEMFSIGGELGFRIPISILEVHFELGGGYAGMGSVGGALTAQSDAVDIGGPYGRVGGGLDFFIGNVFYLGPFASWEFMGLTRPGVNPTEIDPACEMDPEAARECALEREGSGFGSAVSVGVQLGVALP